MNKILTLLSFSALFSISSVAQVPFPTSNATWTQRLGKGEGEPQYSVIGLKNEDVVIGGNTYHKVFESETDVTLATSAYVGGLREDVAARRVYYYSVSSGSEKLLYDFSLSVGDTIRTGPGGAADGIVYSVDMVNIGGIDRTRISFRQLSSSALWPYGEWVEGIGNTGLGGLLGSAMLQPTCDCGTKTLCFSNNGITLYHNANYASIDCDNVFSTTGLNDPTANAVSIYPNPVQGSANIQFGSSSHFTRLLVADATGRTVFAKDVTGLTEYTLDVAQMPPGMYVCSLYTDNGAIANSKLVVSN